MNHAQQSAKRKKLLREKTWEWAGQSHVYVGPYLVPRRAMLLWMCHVEKLYGSENENTLRLVSVALRKPQPNLSQKMYYFCKVLWAFPHPLQDPGLTNFLSDVTQDRSSQGNLEEDRFLRNSRSMLYDDNGYVIEPLCTRSMLRLLDKECITNVFWFWNSDTVKLLNCCF